MQNWNPVVVVNVRASKWGTCNFKIECLLEEVFEDNPWLESDRLYLEHKLSNRELYYVNENLWIRLK